MNKTKAVEVSIQAVSPALKTSSAKTSEGETPIVSGTEILKNLFDLNNLI
jgi:hypothetical protein